MSCQLDLQPCYPSTERSQARTDCLLRSLLTQIEADKRRALSTFGLRFVDNASGNTEEEIVHGDEFEWRPASQLPSFYSRHQRPAALSSSTSTFRLSRRGAVSGARASVTAFRSVVALRRKPSTQHRSSRPELSVGSREMMETVDQTPKRRRRQQQQQQQQPQPQPHVRRRHPAGQPQPESKKPATVVPPEKSPPLAPATTNIAGRLRQRLLQPIRRYLGTSRVGNSGNVGGVGSGGGVGNRSRSTPRLIQLRPRKSTSSVQLRVSDMFNQQKKQPPGVVGRGKSTTRN